MNEFDSRFHKEYLCYFEVCVQSMYCKLVYPTRMPVLNVSSEISAYELLL